MSRRALKRLTPLLVGVAAATFGFLSIGPSFADAGDGPAPVVSVAPPATVVPDVSPSASKKPKPKNGEVAPGPISCASCMTPPD